MNIPKILLSSVLLSFCGAALINAQTPPQTDDKPAPITSITAQAWPYEMEGNIPPKVAFEQWRAQPPKVSPQIFTIDGLSIPAGERPTMMRVAGVLTAPITGYYAFRIQATGKPPAVRADETELWILDGGSGEWRLAQCTGNPNKRTGRTFLEQGVPRQFELWTIARTGIDVTWEVLDFDTKNTVTGDPTVVLERQTVPLSSLAPRTSLPDDRHGDGLLDLWKRTHGLDVDNDMGPNSPWGDPDGDGLLNWQEMLRDSDPHKADTEGSPSLVRWELWRDIPGQYIFDLRRAPHFPTGPREVRFLDRLEIPTGNGERYGSRVRGLLVAPADGEYTFKITAGNSAELWLGENESWQTKRLIAHTDQQGAGSSGWTRRNEKGEKIPLHPEQSATITLKAGQKYYLEILHKQDTGTDHCAVAWVVPGTVQPALITAKNLISWKPCPTDTADDCLPDEWQRTAGLLDATVPPDMRHAEADPDFDGATNREEWLAGTDPLDPTDFPATTGMLTSQSWTNIPGHHIASLVEHPNFPARPDFTTRIDNLDFGQEGENYGVRLRGYLTAPEDGDFHFSIAGNNAAMLYLAESEDKFTKRVVASVEVGTRWRSFATGGHLRSGPIPLKRGKKYYIEVLYKRGADATGKDGQQDHSSVAWTRPGRQQSVIAPEFFSPYQPDPRDLDDDDLPDEWEKLHGLDPTDPSGENGAWGDPDGDGLENFREFQLGLDLRTPDVHGTPGLALWEVWENLHGLLDAHREEGGIAIGLWREQTFPLMPIRSEWRNALDAPRRQGTNFGARLRAHLIAPATGDYIFSIAGRDVGELYLSPDDSKFKRQRIASFRHGTAFRSWDRRPGQMSAPIRLEAGETYYIEALYARGGFQQTDDFFSIGWKPPGEESFKLIDSKHLIAFFRDPNDQDDDDLPDDWEIRYGLDPTNPHGDHGPHGDPDRDGLTNIEEYRLGTNPTNRDTDGDGISDYDEIHVYGTNPLEDDVVPPVKVADLDLSSSTVATGTWHAGENDSLISTTRRGAVEFIVDLETPGLYMLRVESVASSSHSHVPAVPLSVEINGRQIGLMEVGRESTVRGWLTPTLSAGPHTIRLDNRNVTLGVILEIIGVEILLHEDSAPGDESSPPWLAGFHATRNTVAEAPLSSPVSPFCIEGIARHTHLVAITTPHSTVLASEALTGRWFADVPLDPAAPTKLTASFEQGAHSDSLEIEWATTNLFDAAEPIVVRVGDSLKIAAIPPDTTGREPTTIHLDGELIHQGATASPHIVTFDQAGDHIFTASTTTREGQKSFRLEVKVIDGEFGSPDAFPIGASKVWTLPKIDRLLELEADPSVTLQEIETAPASPRQVELALSTAVDRRRMIARLPAGGSIVDGIEIPTFRVVDSARALDAYVVNVLPDGTRVVEIGILIEGTIPLDLLLGITLIVPDAVFTTGDTHYTLRAADFDENGVARVTIYKAPGQGVAAVCHTIDIGQMLETD